MHQPYRRGVDVELTHTREEMHRGSSQPLRDADLSRYFRTSHTFKIQDYHLATVSVACAVLRTVSIIAENQIQ